MKTVNFIIITLFTLQSIIGEEQNKNFSVIPLLNYEYLRFNEQQIHSTGEGIIFNKGNTLPIMEENRNSLMVMGFFKQYFINECEDGYDDIYHSIMLNIEKKINRHLFLGNLSSKASEPFYGGFHTFVGILGYGNEIIRKENISFTIGGVLLITDFGLELPNDILWPVVPLPLLRFNAKTSWINMSIGFMANAMMDFTLFPESRIRLTGNILFNPFTVRDIRDFPFDATLWYRLFLKESKIGDLAGIGIGFKNSGFGMGLLNNNFIFKLSEKDKSYETNYHSIYGIIDLSFLKLSIGYTFSGRETYNEEIIKRIGNGIFINSSLMWRF